MSEERVGYVVVGLGALGSATAWHLAAAGHDVVGLEQFELGHSRGASHDTSRILRHSYHTPQYVALTRDAYDDWARLEAASGAPLVTVVGGLDLFPAGGAIPMGDYTSSLAAEGIAFELLESDEVTRRWPQFSLPSDTVGLFQERGRAVEITLLQEGHPKPPQTPSDLPRPAERASRCEALFDHRARLPYVARRE